MCVRVCACVCACVCVRRVAWKTRNSLNIYIVFASYVSNVVNIAPRLCVDCRALHLPRTAWGGPSSHRLIPGRHSSVPGWQQQEHSAAAPDAASLYCQCTHCSLATCSCALLIQFNSIQFLHNSPANCWGNNASFNKKNPLVVHFKLNLSNSVVQCVWAT